MKLLIPFLALASTVFALPEGLIERRGYQTVHLTFHGGPAEYSMTIPADGKEYPTPQRFTIDTIDMPDFVPYGCEFFTRDPKTLVTSYNTNTGMQSVILGPPQSVYAVKCSGTCIPNYSDCYRNGSPLPGGCCAGYCAANKCRPFIAPGN